MSNEYDVVVLGAGPGGYVAAIRAAQLGLKTAIIEKEYWGGVCLNIGCIPTKALLKSSEVAYTLQNSGKEFGFSFDNLKLDYGVAFKRSRQVSDRLVKGIGFLMKKNKIDTFEGTGTLISPNSISVALNAGGEQVVTGKNLIIATGSRNRALPSLPIDGEKVITYIEAILQDKLPEKVVIVGAGAIGIEFAYVWANYGVDITIVEYAERVLPNEEPEVSKEVARAYKKLGIDMKMGTLVTGVEEKGRGKNKKLNVTLNDGSAIEGVDQVLVAVGFVANTEGIGLENLGVAVNDRGDIQIDDKMRTNVPNVYAIGDCASWLKLAHVGSAMGMVAAEVIGGHETAVLDLEMMPRATYCVPEVASFGLTEAQAKERGYEINIGKFNFQANGRALGMGKRDGFIKIISDKQYGEILGAHMVGPSVSELLPELTLAQMHELTAEEIARNVHAHPTLSEVLMEAAHGVEHTPIHA